MSAKLTCSGQRDPLRFDRPILLLVEGRDDQAFADAQLDLVGDSESWQVHNMGGNKTGWSAGLAVALDDAWFFDQGRAVGLVMDADMDPEAGFDRCKHALTSNRLPEPEGPEQIAFDGRRRSGIFVTPGGGKLGAIEELLLEAAEAARVQKAEAYLEQLERDGFGAFEQRSKSLLQAYLAGQPRLVKTIPVGVRRDEVFPASSDAFESFRSFLRGLAGEDAAEGGALRLN